jgi:pimeloyl-ACP methyl ester carboxylesterase
MTSLENLTLVAHHGSPGTVDDFRYLKSEFTQLNWHSVDRYKDDHGPGQGSLIQVGYSWGSVEAIKSAVKQKEHTKGIILISPYMFASNKMSPVIKTILSLPILGSLMLSKMAPKSIVKMIKDSASPNKVPENYRICETLFSKPEILKPAMLEKDIPTSDIINSLEKAKSLDIPVLVIRGDADETSNNNNEQFEILSKYLEFEEVILKSAGHALLWTHTRGVQDEIKRFLSNLK